MANLLMQSGVKRLKGKNLEENSKIANIKIARMGKKWQNKGFSTAFLGKRHTMICYYILTLCNQHVEIESAKTCWSPPKMLLSY